MPRAKLLLATLGVAAILVFASVGTTAAYLTDARTVTNEFSFGNVRVEVFEDVWSAGGTGVRTLNPGASVAKDPAVRNTGTTPCYVRATVTISDAGTGNSQNILDFIQMGGLNTAGWRLASGHNWGQRQVTVYYIGGTGGILEPGAATLTIFDSFVLNAVDSDGTALLQQALNAFDIIITAQAVQATVDGKTFTSPEDAFAQLMP